MNNVRKLLKVSSYPWAAIGRFYVFCCLLIGRPKVWFLIGGRKVQLAISWLLDAVLLQHLLLRHLASQLNKCMYIKKIVMNERYIFFNWITFSDLSSHSASERRQCSFTLRNTEQA